MTILAMIRITRSRLRLIFNFFLIEYFGNAFRHRLAY
jgi:hypothetical protein